MKRTVRIFLALVFLGVYFFAIIWTGSNNKGVPESTNFVSYLIPSFNNDDNVESAFETNTPNSETKEDEQMH